ncbi:MAG: hypothetical protein M1817_000990 [Caeruleum heppii]|nr:MAG: hypothetical protein M1817_000990 [Caeruleum heppii]
MDIAVTAEGDQSEENPQSDGLNNPGAIAATSVNGSDSERKALGQHGDDNKFQRAISAWRHIDLEHLIPSLDGAASDVVSHQRDSLVQRKDLAQKTKDFRKLDDPAKLGEIKGLLKAYQSFIDLLTNHSKTTSSAFLQLYSSLSEVPDPYPLLEASVDSLVLSEDTLPRLTNENQHLQQAVSKLSSQVDHAEKRLEEERSTRKAVEDKQAAQIKEVEASWVAVVEEKKNNWESKERHLEERVESQERLIKEIKASYEVSQRLGRAEDSSGDATQGSASAAELEILNSDLERTSLRLAEVEARNEQLRLELAQSASQMHIVPQQQAPEEDPAYLRMRSENSSLLRKLDGARIEKESEKRSWETEKRSLNRETIQLKADRDSLREKVLRWRDYDDLQRELDMLKSIEFATGDEDEDLGGSPNDDAPNGSADAIVAGEGNDKAATLEKLLLGRNKKLSSELAIMRVSHQDLQKRLADVEEDTSRTNAELERSRNLAATLENDLLRVQQEASNALPSSARSMAGTYTSRYPQSSYGRKGRASPTSSIISGIDPHGAHTSSDSTSTGEPLGGGSGILPMVTAQRDRFKQRNLQLEEEVTKTHSTVSSLRQEIASLQKDNLDLYEKTRYVSSYNRGKPATASSSSYSAQGLVNPTSINMPSSGGHSGGLDRYRSAYEANVSPFAAFRGRESARALKRMSLPERIVFSITRIVLANRTSRNLFALYCVALHVLVLGMLYWFGTIDIEKHASNLGSLGEGALGSAAGAASHGDAHHGEWQPEGFDGD